MISLSCLSVNSAKSHNSMDGSDHSGNNSNRKTQLCVQGNWLSVCFPWEKKEQFSFKTPCSFIL